MDLLKSTLAPSCWGYGSRFDREGKSGVWYVLPRPSRSARRCIRVTPTIAAGLLNDSWNGEVRQAKGEKGALVEGPCWAKDSAGNLVAERLAIGLKVRDIAQPIEQQLAQSACLGEVFSSLAF